MPAPSGVTAAADVVIIQIPDDNNVVELLEQDTSVGEIVLRGASATIYSLGTIVFMKDVTKFKADGFTFAASLESNILFDYVPA